MDVLKERAQLIATMGRAAGFAAWDRVVQPRAVPGAIPWSVPAVNAEWLQSVLAPDAQPGLIRDVRVEEHSSGTSTRARLWPEYGEGADDLPRSIFCKSTPGFFERMANGASHTMRYETLFYGKLRDELEIEAPRGYYSGWDPARLRSIHLFEDLAENKGAHFCGADDDLSLNDAKQMLTLLATLHGHFWEDARFAGELAHISTFREWFERAKSLTNLRHYHAKAMGEAAAENRLPKGMVGTADLCWQAFERGLTRSDELPATLIHGDVHLGNWYRTGAGDMGLCDWQCISRGPAARDVAYMISSTLHTALRREAERDLLAHYAQALEAAGGPPIAAQDLWRQYCQYLPAALLMWTPTLCPPALLPNMQPRHLALMMVERIATAIDDNGAIEMALSD